MGKLVLGAAALALSAGAASAQTVYPGYDGYTATAPLYDYAGPASSAPVHAAPHGYGPLIYAPQLYAPTPAFPAPPAEPGYYTAQSVVVSQPLYDYAPGNWGADNMITVDRTHKGSKLTPASNAQPQEKQ
jgi:hypothetical protein